MSTSSPPTFAVFHGPLTRRVVELIMNDYQVTEARDAHKGHGGGGSCGERQIVGLIV